MFTIAFKIKICFKYFKKTISMKQPYNHNSTFYQLMEGSNQYIQYNKNYMTIFLSLFTM